VDPTDTANVMWTQPEDSKIFQAFRNDVPVSKDLLKRQPPPRIAPGKVTLDVLNGSGAGGLEYTVAAVLEQDGFKVKRTGNASSHNVTQTLIKYHAGQQPEARLLAAKVHGSALQEVPGTGKITLLLGSNYGSTAHTGPGTKPVPPSWPRPHPQRRWPAAMAQPAPEPRQRVTWSWSGSAGFAGATSHPPGARPSGAWPAKGRPDP
jgi:hypothetical protein